MTLSLHRFANVINEALKPPLRRVCHIRWVNRIIAVRFLCVLCSQAVIIHLVVKLTHREDFFIRLYALKILLYEFHIFG